MPKDDAEISYCCICREKYNSNELFSCYNDHHFCSKCYRHKYYKDKEKRCPQKYCFSWVSVSSISSSTKPDNRSPKKMFPNPHLISQNKPVYVQPSAISLYRGKGSASVVLSRKPVVCPHHTCNKSIAVSSFDSHFKHEHPDIPLIHTYLNGRNGFELYVDDVKYNRKLCIVLINALGNSGDNSSFTPKELRNVATKPSLILLATRLSPFALSELDDEEEETTDTNDDDDLVTDYDNGCTPGDKIVIWLASNIVTKLSYTVAASTPCNGIRLKYFGPIRSLDISPTKLFAEGSGMILNYHQYMGMTDNGQKHLVLHLIVHGDE